MKKKKSYKLFMLAIARFLTDWVRPTNDVEGKNNFENQMITGSIDKSVLIVEDDVPLAQAVSNALKERGFAVKVTYDGEAGLQEIIQHNYEVIYLGIFLPLKNGLDVIKEMPKEKRGNVVVFTRLLNNVIGDKAKSFGVREYVALKDLKTIDNVISVIEKKYNNILRES